MSVLATIQEELQHVDELIAQLERSAAETARPSIFANIRSLEKERRNLQLDFDRAAASAKVDVCRYRVVNQTPATIDGLTSVWREFQNALSLVYYSLKGQPLPRPSGKKTKRTKTALELPPPLQLGFGYTFPGSVGLAFTLPRETLTDSLFPDSDAVMNAASTIFDLAKAYRDPETVHRFARQLGPVPVEAMYKWVSTNIEHHYGAGVDIQRDGEITNRMVIQYEEFGVLSEELARTTVDEEIRVVGSLVAVDTLARSFRIDADTGETYSGTYETAITADHAARVPYRYQASILRIIKVIPTEGERDTYSLISLEGLDKPS
jgi:hypothetical protein